MQILAKNCCTWIDGDVKLGTATWCGAPVRAGTVWCDKHGPQVYVTRYQKANRLPGVGITRAGPKKVAAG